MAIKRQAAVCAIRPKEHAVDCLLTDYGDRRSNIAIDSEPLLPKLDSGEPRLA
jgi:hypothetical protein